MNTDKLKQIVANDASGVVNYISAADGKPLVDAGLIETASSFGATPLQIVFKVLIPEALPGLLLALTLAVVSLLGYSAMVGAVGGGGLGDLGIRYGYQRFMPEMMLAVVVVLIALVQTVQTVGDYFAKRVNRRLRHR